MDFVVADVSLSHVITSAFDDTDGVVLLQTVKLGVQYSLWGGSVLNLGTSKHRQRFFDDINSLRCVSQPSYL